MTLPRHDRLIPIAEDRADGPGGRGAVCADPDGCSGWGSGSGVGAHVSVTMVTIASSATAMVRAMAVGRRRVPVIAGLLGRAAPARHEGRDCVIGPKRGRGRSADAAAGRNW